MDLLSGKITRSEKAQEEPEARGNVSSEDSVSTQEEGGQDGQGC